MRPADIWHAPAAGEAMFRNETRKRPIKDRNRQITIRQELQRGTPVDQEVQETQETETTDAPASSTNREKQRFQEQQNHTEEQKELSNAVNTEVNEQDEAAFWPDYEQGEAPEPGENVDQTA